MTAIQYTWHADAWRLACAGIARGAHALLLSGAKGLGKRALAIRLAESYLCGSQGSQGQACGSCESCRWFAAGTHPDFALVEPLQNEGDSETATGQVAGARARSISVDQVRQLGGLLALTGHRNEGRVMLINPAENMNAAAANALLKNLEEPPARTLFVLVTHRPVLLPPTVRSRCQLVRVKLDDWNSAEAWMRSQGIENAAEYLAFCGGAPLEAAAIVSDPAWGRRREFLRDLCADGTDGVALATNFRDLGPGIILSWLQKWTFDLLMLRFCGRARFHPDLGTAEENLARSVDPVSLARLHRRLLVMQKIIHHPLNPRLLIEHMLIDCREVLVPSRGAIG